MANLIFTEDAFIPLITSCIEVYRKECFGILLGKKRGSNFKIEACLPYQSATRGYRSISIARNREKRVNEVLQCISDLSVLGDFHSHTGDVIDYLSATDIEDLYRLKNDFISVLVCINETKKYESWRVIKGCCIRGSIGKYTVDIKGFQYIQKDKSIIHMDIDCPYIQKLNKSFCRVNKRSVR